jgi:two-component system, OmpR family, response regulator
MRILLVEDDPQLGDAVRSGLTQDRYVVDWVQTGSAARAVLDSQRYEAVLLDLGLPEISGTELLAALRRKRDTVPVIVITARDQRADKIGALDLGADDYVVKPFDLDELAARIRAVVRRRAGGAEAVLRHGAIELDSARHVVQVAGRTVALGRHEYALLQALMSQPGAVLSRARLEDSLYGWGDEVGSNAVEVHMHHLRRKLGVDVIRTVRGVGYKLE